MAHSTRGDRSAAYEILEVVKVDPDTVTLTIRHAASYELQPIAINAKNTPAARQMLAAMAASIKVSPTADRYSGWESATTVLHGTWIAKSMLGVLAGKGIDNFNDLRLDIPTLRTLYEPLQENTKRTAAHLLARSCALSIPTAPACRGR
jgi:hypothetical protein